MYASLIGQYSRQIVCIFKPSYNQNEVVTHNFHQTPGYSSCFPSWSSHQSNPTYVLPIVSITSNSYSQTTSQLIGMSRLMLLVSPLIPKNWNLNQMSAVVLEGNQ